MIILNTVQGSDEWLEERWTCVTGTRIQSAVGAKYTKAKGWTLGDKKVQRTLMMEIVSEMQSEMEINDFTSAAMQRGHDLEPVSVAAASERLGVNFEVCGMLQSETLPRFKFSPDAVQIENGVVVSGYETKSKMGKTHIEYQLDDEVPTEHLWQCLCPMIMSDDVKFWAFGHFDDRNKVNPLFLKVITREEYEDFILQARALLVQFFLDAEIMVNKLGGSYDG